MTQSMLSDEQIEEIVYIVLNHGQVDDAVAEIREYLTALAPPAAPASDREAVTDDVGALIVPETGVPLAEWPEVKALGNGSAIAPPAQPAEERAVVQKLTSAETAPEHLDDDQSDAWVDGWNACVAALSRARTGSEAQ